MSYPSRSVFALPVLPASQLRVVHGANMGDALSVADDLMLDDTYGLVADSALTRLSLLPQDDGVFQVARKSEAGTLGAMICLDSCLTMMSPDGQTSELLVLVELSEDGHIAQVFALPLAPMQPKTEYHLVGIDTQGAQAKLAEVACVSFARGTHITLATGAQCAIEDLCVGDRVLTRDDGPQEIRWIGQSTTRAVGEFAPIRIAAGALHNAGDLILSPGHRLFMYQRSDELGVGRSEVLIRAGHLVNGTTITRQDGGFVDYFQLLFDTHQIIFAEGIAAETLLLDDRTRPALPTDLAQTFAEAGLKHDARQHQDYEVGESLVNRPDIDRLLRRATTG
ncbi:Hint domain-containing protein [Thalassovita sp.]|uniref:Hint domain-containing protein n=1 Tax=Thalassovita sp. TaxID=1979401 RepID=UPI00288106A9|nr:Hint domain-containing protein [Thalassovita sp.]MDF1802838.1 Hint domain-containing protein [Thalassovita sp.]